MTVETPPPTATALIQSVAAENEITWTEIMNRNDLRQHVVSARHDAWERLRNMKDDRGRRLYTLTRIGSWWAMRHTSVQQAVARRVH